MESLASDQGGDDPLQLDEPERAEHPTAATPRSAGTRRPGSCEYTRQYEAADDQRYLRLCCARSKIPQLARNLGLAQRAFALIVAARESR